MDWKGGLESHYEVASQDLLKWLCIKFLVKQANFSQYKMRYLLCNDAWFLILLHVVVAKCTELVDETFA